MTLVRFDVIGRSWGGTFNYPASTHWLIDCALAQNSYFKYLKYEFCFGENLILHYGKQNEKPTHPIPSSVTQRIAASRLSSFGSKCSSNILN